MRFNSQGDYRTFLHFNKEIINTIIDTPVVLYKLNIIETQINLYGESTKKVHYTGVQIPCLISRKNKSALENMGLIDFEQPVTFAFLRGELTDRNVYPEAGDIIDFHSDYYEIDNADETQLVAGQIEYNHQILCSAHLTKNASVNLEKSIL